MIVHTEAIVFRTVDFKESSRIVTLFTREQGKLAVMVHGARKPKGKFGGLMEVGNLLEVVYYYKSTRSVQTLSEASYLEKTLQLRTDFRKMALMTSSVELINQLLHEGEVNVPIYRRTRNFLLWLDRTERDPRAVFPYLQLRLAEDMGLGIRLLPGGEGRDHYLTMESGEVSTESDARHAYKLTQNQLLYVRLALGEESGALFRVDFDSGELKALIQLLDRYLQYHVEGLKERRSDAIFEQILE
ncbi:MAG: DNA repair protein RecO [Balneolaceae bacterium]|nr:DNA repair protein RecO [Balneolaceae bacterium]